MWIYLNDSVLLKKKKDTYQSITIRISINKNTWQDFRGGPVIKILPSSAGVGGLIPGQGAGFPHAYQSKKKNPKTKA